MREHRGIKVVSQEILREIYTVMFELFSTFITCFAYDFAHPIFISYIYIDKKFPSKRILYIKFMIRFVDF